MKKILVFFSLLLSVCSAAQQNSHGLYLKLAPLSLYTLYVGPSVRMSAEYKVKNTVLENQLGFFFYYSTGFLAATEVKYYREENSNEGEYFSWELFYKYQAYNVNDSTGSFFVSKNVECFTVKYGNLLLYKNGLLLEGYCGLGVRFQQNKNTLDFLSNEYMQPTTDYGPNIILNKERNSIYPNLVAGVKVGYAFRKSH